MASAAEFVKRGRASPDDRSNAVTQKIRISRKKASVNSRPEPTPQHLTDTQSLPNFERAKATFDDTTSIELDSSKTDEDYGEPYDDIARGWPQQLQERIGENGYASQPEIQPAGVYSRQIPTRNVHSPNYLENQQSKQPAGISGRFHGKQYNSDENPVQQQPQQQQSAQQQLPQRESLPHITGIKRKSEILRKHVRTEEPNQQHHVYAPAQAYPQQSYVQKPFIHSDPELPQLQTQDIRVLQGDELTDFSDDNRDDEQAQMPHSDPIDYSDGELRGMTYKQLAEQTWEKEDAQEGQPEPQPTSQNPSPKTLEERWNALRRDFTHQGQNDDQNDDSTSAAHYNFYAALEVAEWEQVGDMFVEQFADVMKGLVAARKKKREIIRQGEQEVGEQEAKVRGVAERLEKKLENMKTGGLNVLQGKDV